MRTSLEMFLKGLTELSLWHRELLVGPLSWGEMCQPIIDVGPGLPSIWVNIRLAINEMWLAQGKLSRSESETIKQGYKSHILGGWRYQSPT
jgi:hypothetical protein